MQKAHDPSKNDHWKNYPDISSPIIARELNRMEVSMDVIDDRVVAFDTNKANQSDLLTCMSGFAFDAETGIITITWKNGVSTPYDTGLAKLAVNFDYDDDPTSPHYQQIILELKDGTYKYIDLSALITQFEFTDTPTIAWTVENDGTVKANVINGSITEEKLQPNFLADCRVQAGRAEDAALSSEAWAKGTKGGVPVQSTDEQYQNNSKYFSEMSEDFSEDSEAWAKGQRNGTDVPSTDPAFHNNAYYWAQQARAIVGDKVDSFNGRSGVVSPENGDYSMDQIAPPSGVSNGQIPVVRNVGTSQTEWAFVMENYSAPHKILNPQGTQLIQRENLQFLGNVEVTDDSNTSRTKVHIPEYTPEKLGSGYAECDTASATTAKVATLTDYQLVVNGIVAVKFTYDVPANSTLNVNNQGAKPMYYQGVAIVADIIKAGDTTTFMYSDSEHYEVISIDRGGSGGSAGHTILDGDGTAMTAQPNLQFADANVENDGTNNATVVRNFVDINWDDWQEVDDNDNTYYRVTDAPLVDGNVEVDIMKKLWENPAPTASFAEQNITLSSNDYDFLVVMAYYGSNALFIPTVIAPKGAKIQLNASTSTANGVGALYRNITVNSDTSLHVGGCALKDMSASATTNNGLLIPVAIYGIKQKVSISLSAIISNVSTSASKCMLSDGETSVEDVLNYSTDEHIVGKWIDGSILYEKTVVCGALANATNKNVAHGISNLYCVISIEGIAVDPTSSKTFKNLPFPIASGTGAISLYVDDTYIRITTTNDQRGYNGYITLRYTKTS